MFKRKIKSKCYEFSKALSQLTKQQMLYATYMGLASWAGFPILLSQVSEESVLIHIFLMNFMEQYPIEILNDSTNSLVFQWVVYISRFYSYGGNYFGDLDTIIYPTINENDLEGILSSYPSLLEEFLEIKDVLYGKTKGDLKTLGFYPSGTSAYYYPDKISEEEVKAIDHLILNAEMKLENTFIRRCSDRYEVCLPSIEIDTDGFKIGEYNTIPVVVTKGRHSETLKKVVHWLKLAKKYAENELQIKSIEELIIHFTTGNIQDHIKYSEYWVLDKNPIVETSIGFIEPYRDPDGTRCEFEGFVACVDKSSCEIQRKFIEAAPKILSMLPITPEYQRTTFIPPSYNSLCVLTYCTSSIPVGKNIPNYNEIRNVLGFKNLNLSNVSIALESTKEFFSYLYEDDVKFCLDNQSIYEDIDTAIHEVYGHGSGKMLMRSDVEGNKVPDLLTPGKFVTTYYEENSTAEQILGKQYSALEECRADTTAAFLFLKDEILDIFEIDKDPEFRLNLKYGFILGRCNDGINSTGQYNPDTMIWINQHSQANFMMLRALLMWGRGSVSIQIVYDDEYVPFRISVDKNRFDAINDALEKLLVHLNYFKSTNQPESALEFIRMLSSLDETWLKIRDTRQYRDIMILQTYGAIIRKDENGEYYLERMPPPDTQVKLIQCAQNNIRLAADVPSE